MKPAVNRRASDKASEKAQQNPNAERKTQMKTTTKSIYAASVLIIVTICGLSGNTVAQASQGTGSSSIPSGLFLIRAAVADFNGDGHPDFVVRNRHIRRASGT